MYICIHVFMHICTYTYMSSTQTGTCSFFFSFLFFSSFLQLVGSQIVMSCSAIARVGKGAVLFKKERERERACVRVYVFWCRALTGGVRQQLEHAISLQTTNNDHQIMIGGFHVGVWVRGGPQVAVLHAYVAALPMYLYMWLVCQFRHATLDQVAALCISPRVIAFVGV